MLLSERRACSVVCIDRKMIRYHSRVVSREVV